MISHFRFTIYFKINFNWLYIHLIKSSHYTWQENEVCYKSYFIFSEDSNFCKMADLFKTLGVLILFIGSVISDEFCPTTIPQCYCRPKWTFYHYIYCEYLGDVMQVPEFSASNRTYEELQVRYDSTIEYVQDHAFDGIIVESLKLQYIGLRRLGLSAFAGLEPHLRELHLDDNYLTEIPRQSIAGLVNLRHLGLHNNLLQAYDPQLFSTLTNLSYVYLFNNQLRYIPMDSF